MWNPIKKRFLGMDTSGILFKNWRENQDTPMNWTKSFLRYLN